jgi:hypothetical protein
MGPTLQEKTLSRNAPFCYLIVAKSGPKFCGSTVRQ